MNIDVVNISFGGFLDRSIPDENRIYRLYERAGDYAKSRGTAIVASAGNNHVEIGAGGRVLSHGNLTTPGTARADFSDLYGLYEVPGGIRGVVCASDREGSAERPPLPPLSGRWPAPATVIESSEGGDPHWSTIRTSRVRGPCTPSTRFSSMSLVADGPEIRVIGRWGNRAARAIGTDPTTWPASTTHRR